MCKIFAMTDMSRVNFDSNFIDVVKSEVCRLSDKDGFGYSTVSNSGVLGGERTIKVSEFTPLQYGAKFKTPSLPIVSKSKNYFGKILTKEVKSFIAHGRLSTNKVCLENTHPFYNGEVSLIHNGVVQDYGGKAGPLTSTCDTEILLNYWNKGGLDEIAENVTGYYALAILDKHGYLHVVRDDRAKLFIAYSRSVKSFLIATTPDIIKNIAKRLSWQVEQPEEILENTYTVFNRNAIMSNRSFAPRKVMHTMTMTERSALGYSSYVSAAERTNSVMFSGMTLNEDDGGIEEEGWQEDLVEYMAKREKYSGGK